MLQITLADKIFALSVLVRGAVRFLRFDWSPILFTLGVWVNPNGDDSRFDFRSLIKKDYRDY